MLRLLVGLILGVVLGIFLALTYPHQLHSALAHTGLDLRGRSDSEPRNNSRANFP